MAHSTTFRRACAVPALGHIAPLQVNVATTRLVSPSSRFVPAPRSPGDNWGWASGEIPVFGSTESGRVGKKFSGVSRRRAIEETAESPKGPELGGARFDGPSGTKKKNVKLS